MPIPAFNSVSILSFSPLCGIRRASGTTLEVLQETDLRGTLHQQQCQQLAALTKQEDPLLRLVFGLWAIDKAPSPDLAARVPLEIFILHYARTLPAWSMLGRAPALNIVALDWPSGDGYEVRVYLVGTDSPMAPESLPFFYEARRDEVSADVRAGMPLIVR